MNGIILHPYFKKNHKKIKIHLQSARSILEVEYKRKNRGENHPGLINNRPCLIFRKQRLLRRGKKPSLYFRLDLYSQRILLSYCLISVQGLM